MINSLVQSVVKSVGSSIGGVSGGGSGPTPDPTLAALKAAAVSLWTLNEPTGDFTDLIGSNDLIVSGLINRVSGKVGNAVNGQVGSVYALRANATELSPADTSFWVAAWVRLDDPTAHQGVFGSVSLDSTNGWALRTDFDNDGELRIAYINAGNDGASQPIIGSGSDGQWHLCVFGYEHVAQKLWWSFDGSAVSQETRTVGVGASGVPFSVFGTNFVGPVDETVDEIGFYAGDRPTSQMIAALYNSGAGISNSTIAAA